MPEPDLIADYLAGLSARLPGPIVEELADGLAEAYRGYRDRGLDPGAAARAAVAEFGDQRVIVAGFIAASPARRLARRLLLTGPGMGLCWGVVLVGSRAWAWPVPIAGRAAFGALLLLAVGLLAAAAGGRNLRSVSRAGAAACLSLALADASMISIAIELSLQPRWPVAIAVTASALRLAYALRKFPQTFAALRVW